MWLWPWHASWYPTERNELAAGSIGATASITLSLFRKLAGNLHFKKNKNLLFWRSSRQKNKQGTPHPPSLPVSTPKWSKEREVESHRSVNPWSGLLTASSHLKIYFSLLKTKRKKTTIWAFLSTDRQKQNLGTKTWFHSDFSVCVCSCKRYRVRMTRHIRPAE